MSPAAELGIFAPVAGRIVYSDSSLWAVDPSAPSPDSTQVRLGPVGDLPLGWSSDGTELLFMRERIGDEPVPDDATSTSSTRMD